jgi:hypothetical protein
VRFTVRSLMIVLAAVGLVLGGITCVARKVENRLFVENRAGQPIAWIRIATRASTVSFENVPDGELVTALFHIAGDDDFAVTRKLADGTGLGGNHGYVTNGMYGERARFVIQRDGKIDFSQGGDRNP